MQTVAVTAGAHNRSQIQSTQTTGSNLDADAKKCFQNRLKDFKF